MVDTCILQPGVTLHCVQSGRFKTACLSLQFLRPMTESEAGLNALLPSVLLRGTQRYGDLRRITRRLDDLYGASVSAMVRRVGDYQGVGLYAGFMEERFALEGDRILEPMVQLLEELLLHPATRDGSFCPEYVESEKRNLCATIESQINDKQAYAMNRLLRNMCAGDSFGVPRLGTVEQVRGIDGPQLYVHYQKVLRQSPVEIFYVGSASADRIAGLLRPVFEKMQRSVQPLPAMQALCAARPSHEEQQLEVAQAKLCMGFVTPVTNRTERFVAMQLLNVIYGSGMTSKLFMNIREKQSLCYSVGSSYYASKGVMTVYAGIDADKEEQVRRQVQQELENCCRGAITAEEFAGAKAAMLSDLRSVHDSPGAMEAYYSAMLICGVELDAARHMALVEQTVVADVVRAAQSLQLHSSFIVKGVSAQ